MRKMLLGLGLVLAACGSSAGHSDGTGGDGGASGSSGSLGASGGPGSIAGDSGASGEFGELLDAGTGLPARPGRWAQSCGQPIPAHVVEVENAGAGGESPFTVPATNGCARGLDCIHDTCSFELPAEPGAAYDAAIARCTELGGAFEGMGDEVLYCVPR